MVAVHPIADMSLRRSKRHFVPAADKVRRNKATLHFAGTTTFGWGMLRAVNTCP
jgi:hypothetical protein